MTTRENQAAMAVAGSRFICRNACCQSHNACSRACWIVPSRPSSVSPAAAVDDVQKVQQDVDVADATPDPRPAEFYQRLYDEYAR